MQKVFAQPSDNECLVNLYIRGQGLGLVCCQGIESRRI